MKIAIRTHAIENVYYTRASMKEKHQTMWTVFIAIMAGVGRSARCCCFIFLYYWKSH